MRRSAVQRARAFLVSLSRPGFVIVMTFITFAVAVPVVAVASVLGGEMKTPTLLDAMPFLVQVLLGVVFVPPIETAALQWAPIVLCTRRLGMSTPTASLVSALLFGLAHGYSVSYVLAAFVIGLALSWTFFLAIARGESPFWMVTAVHALRNLVTFALRTLL